MKGFTILKSLVFGVCFALLFTGCTSNLNINDWQTVHIKEGAFKIPSDWTYYSEDDQIYIEKDGQLIMNQVMNTDGFYSDKHTGEYQPISSNGKQYTNFVYVFNVICSQNGVKYRVRSISFPSSNGDLWVWSDDISDGTIRLIAESFQAKE